MARARQHPAAKRYRFVGPHAIILESGATLAPEDFINLDEESTSPLLLDAIDQGWLIEAANGKETESEEE